MSTIPVVHPISFPVYIPPRLTEQQAQNVIDAAAIMTSSGRVPDTVRYLPHRDPSRGTASHRDDTKAAPSQQRRWGGGKSADRLQKM